MAAPEALKNVARRVDQAFPWQLAYRGDAVACPCCGGTFRGMRSFHGRPNAKCPQCGALERHRALWLYLEREFGIKEFTGRMLHMAPEPIFERWFRSLPGIDYTAGDLMPQRPGIEVVDATRMQFADASFDVVMMNHVLEHIPDDAAAIREMRRVLKPGGVALMQHPMDEAREATYEDPSITTPADRLKHFNQRDHVRVYGRDFPSRLEAGGFAVERHRYADEVAPADRDRYGLAPDGRSPSAAEDIYVLRPA